MPLFPAGFRLGTAVSAQETEGSADVDGRGPSIWDDFEGVEGRTSPGAPAVSGADHYRQRSEDVALLKRFGIRAHRFSVAWSRIQPEGRGPVNAAGLDHYDRHVDELLAAGIEPMVSLHHWDLPQALESDGGWLNRATSDAFGDYAAIVAERLADRVAHWIPLHSPNSAAVLGYGLGVHAPGKSLVFDSLPAAHHMLLAHGLGAQALRAAGAASVGCANIHTPAWPASDEPEDTGTCKLFDMLWNGFFMEAMLLGRYPQPLTGPVEHVVRPGDMATIRQPLDFYGVNFFNPIRVGAAPEGYDLPFAYREVIGYPLTDRGRPVVPDSLREWLIMFRARYRAALPPIMITESGADYSTEPDECGVVNDQPRIDYVNAYLNAVAEAVNRGVDVRGYYYSSLLDGHEWTDGYTQRSGLVHVDHTTQVRTPKCSMAWYASVSAAQPTDN